MRTLWTVGAMGSMALGTSCVLPGAVVVAGDADSTVVPVLVAQDDAEIMAPSGNGTQHHLIFAASHWWVFVPNAGGMTVKTSADFNAWTPNPGISGKNAGLAYGSTQLDGRVFGIDTNNIMFNDVVHLSLSGATTSANPVDHARAVIENETGVTGLGFDTATAGPTLDGALSAGRVDGTVTLVAAPLGEVFDFASLSAPAAGDSCVLSAMTPDDGKHDPWKGDFSATPLADDGGTFVPIRGAVALPGYVAVLWPSQSGLLWSERLLSDAGAPWGAPAPIGVDATTTGGRDWGVCAEPAPLGMPTRAAHLLVTDGTGFHHFENTDGTSWELQSLSPNGLSGGVAVTELFVACDAGRVYAFTILGAPTKGSPIQETVWDVATGQWSDWATVVEPSPAAQRCFLTGYDQVTDGGTGLLWTESPDCTAPAPVQLFGALVPL